MMLMLLMGYSFFNEVFSVDVSKDAGLVDARFCDVDSDGNLDLVVLVSKWEGDDLYIYRARSKGVLDSSPIKVFEGNNVRDWTVYNIDGDKYLDFAVTEKRDWDDYRVTFYRNNALSSFDNVTGDVPSGYWSSLVQISDLDGDGFRELYAVKDSPLGGDIREVYVLYVNATNPDNVSINSTDLVSSVDGASNLDPSHDSRIVRMAYTPLTNDGKYFMAVASFFGGKEVRVLYRKPSDDSIVSKSFNYTGLYTKTSDPGYNMTIKSGIIRVMDDPWGGDRKWMVISRPWAGDSGNPGFIFYGMSKNPSSFDDLESGAVNYTVSNYLYSIYGKYIVPGEFLPSLFGFLSASYYVPLGTGFQALVESSSYLYSKDVLDSDAEYFAKNVEFKDICDFDGDGVDEIVVYDVNTAKVSVLKMLEKSTDKESEVGVVILSNRGKLELLAKDDLVVKFYEPISGLLLGEKRVSKGSYAAFDGVNLEGSEKSSGSHGVYILKVKIKGLSTGKSMWLTWSLGY